MELSTKEKELLKDLRDQEKLCITKYDKYAASACSSELQTLFNSMAKVEREHHKTIVGMMDGKVESAPSAISNSMTATAAAAHTRTRRAARTMRLCARICLLPKSMSRRFYDTCVFEFTNPQARKMLNHIQAEEQQHGQQLYAFMSNNNMYS